MTWLIFFLSVYGFANAITTLKIGELFRGTLENPKRLGRIPFFGKIFFCPTCLGFWVGMVVSLTLLSPAREFVGIWWKAMILDGLSVSAAIYLFHLICERIHKGSGPLDI